MSYDERKDVLKYYFDEDAEPATKKDNFFERYGLADVNQLREAMKIEKK